MRVGFFVIAVVCFGCVSVAYGASSACALPNDGDPAVNSDCPAWRWTQTDAGVLVQDGGEALWADAVGTLHVATQPENVPEPYRALYRALRKQGDGAYHVVDDVPAFRVFTPEADAESAHATQVAQSRQRWRDDVTWWRNELYVSTRALLQEVLNPAGDSINPVAFAYGPDREEHAMAHAQAVAEARNRVLRARTMLLETLPLRARQAGVPALWLQ